MSDILNLSKTFELTLEKSKIFYIPKMDTKLAVDRSGSMQEEFDCGWVDKTIDLFIAASLTFDDNGSLEIGFFNHDFILTPPATAKDAGRYTKLHNIRAGGGTAYSSALRELANFKTKPSMLGRLFGKKEVAPKPAYIGFITDGDCMDPSGFQEVLESMPGSNFLQIIAIGNQVTLGMFKRISDMPNVSLIHIRNPHAVNDEMFYELICSAKLASWLKTIDQTK